MLGSATCALVGPCSETKRKNVSRFSSICEKLGTAGKWSNMWMCCFVESCEQNPEREMVLEASITTGGYLSIGMLGENGIFWP